MQEFAFIVPILVIQALLLVALAILAVHAIKNSKRLQNPEA